MQINIVKIIIITLWIFHANYCFSIEIISNGGIERGTRDTPNRWKRSFFKNDKYSSQLSWENHSEVSRTGEHSLKIMGGNGAWRTSFKVTEGKLYRIKFYFKCKTDKDYNPNASFNCYLSSPKKGIVLWMRKKKLRLFKDWQLVHVGDYIAESGIKSLNLYLRLHLSNNDKSEIWFDDISVKEIDPPKYYNAAKYLDKNDDYTLWLNSASQKVYRDDPVPETKTEKREVEISAAKGEAEPFQIVITPDSEWRNISWQWTDLSGPAIILKDNLKCYRVEYINIKKPTPVYGRKGLIPDPLIPEKISNLLSGQNNPFWFLLEVPSSADPGIYSGELTLKKGANIVSIIPIKLKVWNFSIPEKPSIPIDSHIWIKDVMNYEKGNYLNISDKFDVSKRYYKNVFNHRATSAPNSRIPVSIKDGKVRTDTVELGMHIEYIKTLNDCENLRLNGVLKIEGEDRGKHLWKKNSTWQGIPIFIDNGNEVINLEFKNLFTQHIMNIIDTLKSSGCFSKLYIKFFDEPNVSDTPTVNAMTNIAKLLKTIDPNIRPSGSGSPHISFLPYFGRWDFPSGQYAEFYSEELAEAKKNNAAWVYDNSIPLQDLPLLRTRLLHWLLWKEKLNGAYNWWSITYWNDNPWDSATPNSGSLLYPPRNNNEIGPITSLRWEMMRQGLEDYEYLNLLEKLIVEKRDTASQELISSAELTLNRVSEVVHRFAVGSNDQPYTLDPNLVEKVKSQIAEAIDNLVAAEYNYFLKAPESLRVITSGH